MGMAVIRVMCPELFIYTLVSPSCGCFIYNLGLIGQAVSNEMFEYYVNDLIYMYVALGWGQMNPRVMIHIYMYIVVL